ncbi:uncharacterized protein [Littorina saxatilis]|uniref:uncharacterized protein n=1 Tax=Littorina saxatilis TaxID=31220 RepID=UPI0038B64967
MSLWSARKPLYKLGVFGVYVGFVLFMVGFSLPYWFYASPSEGSQGLWQYCNGMCRELQVEQDWFELVRALLCITLIAYFAACALAIYDNCLIKYDPLTYKPARRMEIVTLVTGLLGGSSMAVYTVMMKIEYKEYPRNYFGVSYDITIAACGLAFLLAALLSVTGSTQAQHVQLTSPGHRFVMTYQSTSNVPSGSHVHAHGPTPTPYLYPPIPKPSVWSPYHPDNSTTFSNPGYITPSIPTAPPPSYC